MKFMTFIELLLCARHCVLGTREYKSELKKVFRHGTSHSNEKRQTIIIK